MGELLAGLIEGNPPVCYWCSELSKANNMHWIQQENQMNDRKVAVKLREKIVHFSIKNTVMKL
jgi:hypothetical protein